MTDFELNKKIAEALGYAYGTSSINNISSVEVMVSLDEIFNRADYCKNWNDLIPLMIKHDSWYQLSGLSTQREMAEALLHTLRN